MIVQIKWLVSAENIDIYVAGPFWGIHHSGLKTGEKDVVLNFFFRFSIHK